MNDSGPSKPKLRWYVLYSNPDSGGAERKVLWAVLGSILLFSIAGCENSKNIGIRVGPDIPQLVLKRGQTETVTCYVAGMGKGFSPSYVGMVTMSAECTEGIVTTPSRWEMQMGKGHSNNQASAELAIAVSDDAPLGSHTVKIVGTIEDGTTTAEKVYELTVTTDSQYESVSQLRELGHEVMLNPQGNVVSVGFFSVRFTDKALEHLDGLTELKRLSLSKTKITDAGLEHLKGLDCLERLNLSGTQVTDAGLEHLKGLTKLKGISILLGPQVTAEGLKKFQEALPDCKIEHSY